MRKLISTLFLFCTMAFAAQAQIVINEISYNTPSVDVEFIELYNNSSNTVDLSGWSFSEGITYTFPSGISMPANAYLLVCEDSLRMVNYFGVNAYQWSSGNLSNGGEDIILVDDMGAGIDTVDYEDNTLGWPEICDGQGPSLVLCDVNSNNNDPANWSFSTTSSGTRHGTDSSMLFCSPGAANAACPTSPVIILNGTYDEVSEGSGSYDLSFFMANTGPSDTSSVDVTVTMASTASGSTDYTFTTTTVGIGPDGFAGRSFASVTIPLIDDMIPEADETIVFSLSNPSLGATIANAGDYVLKIIDDDPVDSIATVTTNDANGVADSLNAQVALRGVVYGVDMQGGNSVQFTLIDSTGGIAVFSGNSFGYTVNEGDGLFMTGTISQFNGLTQLNPDTIFVESTGNALVSPAVVTALDESTESELVRINGVSLVTPSQWPAAGSNANVDITDGTNTYTLRIDRDTDVDGTPAPAGTFDVIGLGGQFDNSSPFDAGYQILPRYQADIITGNTGSGLPLYPIATVTTNDANGVADSSGVQCELRGVVYGVDMQGSASVSFTVIDPTGGIGVFSSNDYGYTVTEGDSVHIPGTIGQFNGLTQINPDTIILVATGSALINPAVVTALDESTESELVRINGVSLVDPTQWPASGSSANVDLTDGTNTYLMRIDSDTDVDGMPAPTGNFDVVGLGGQFDNSSPFDGGYQILPRYMPDIILPPAPLPRYNIGLITTDNDNNGVADSLNVRCEIQGIVHGVDLQGGGSVQFTVIDSTGGIGVFSSNDYGYTVLEGDEVLIPGEVSEFRGLSQMTPDTIIVLSTGNTLTTPW
jgi:predicted extracellular nuclease